MRDRLARVGIRHAHVQDLGRRQRGRQRRRSRGGLVRLDRDPLVGEPWVTDDQARVQILAHAAHGEAALGIRRHRPGPCREIVGVSVSVDDPIRPAMNRARWKLNPSPCGIAENRHDRDPDIRNGPALHVEQPPLDHLLRPEGDVGGRLIVVGIELDPADTITGRQGDGAEILVARRRRPGCIDPEPARAVCAGVGERDHLELRRKRGPIEGQVPRVDHNRSARQRFSIGVEYAADHEHPGGRGRIGVIGLRGGRWRIGQGNFRLIAPRRIGRTGGDGGGVGTATSGRWIGSRLNMARSTSLGRAAGAWQTPAA